MQRKATKNTRGPNSDEKAYQAWLKEQPCVNCGAPGPSIVDHCEGSTFRNLKVLIGHWFCICLCPACDEIKTIGNHKRQYEEFGMTNPEMWVKLIKNYPGNPPPFDVVKAITLWRR